MMRTTIDLLIDTKESGKPAYEQVLVDARDDGTYELLASPGLVLGLAAGDVFRVSAAQEYELVSRGGNLSIQMYRRTGIDEVERFATTLVKSIGGRHDGHSQIQLVYTVPVSIGFPAVNRAMKSIVERYPDVRWYFGNVYDPADSVTPLNWWK